MIQPELAERIATQADTLLRPADALALDRLHALRVPPSVLDFYRSYEPASYAEIEGVRLWSIASDFDGLAKDTERYQGLSRLEREKFCR